jgi:hypothetical protein
MPAGFLQAQVMIRADEGKVLHIEEIQTIFVEKDGAIVAEAVLPLEKRPKSFRDLQISKNDTLLMVNGKRVETVKELEDLYHACRAGEPFKLGLRGKKGLRIVAFDKMEREQGLQKNMIKVTVGDQDSQMVKQVIDENGKVLSGEEAERFIEKMKEKNIEGEDEGVKIEVEEPAP